MAWAATEGRLAIPSEQRQTTEKEKNVEVTAQQAIQLCVVLGACKTVICKLCDTLAETLSILCTDIQCTLGHVGVIEQRVLCRYICC